MPGTDHRTEEEVELLPRLPEADILCRRPSVELRDGDEGDEYAPDALEQRSRWGEASLFLQHLSSTFTAAAYDFALFLYLVDIFPTTIVPASLVGLTTKLAGLVFANQMGGLVDIYPRLQLIRWTIAAQKGFKLLSLGFIALLMAHWGSGCLVGVAACSASLALANTVLEVAVERDWVTTIAVDSDHLTELNTRMRRIDLLSKLVAPLSVSLCTTALGYHTTLVLLAVWVLMTCIAEYLWIEVVHRLLPVLSRYSTFLTAVDSPRDRSGSSAGVGAWWTQQEADWDEFRRMPIFASSLAIASIYLTTLSYDGTFIAYVKVARGHGDAFIAAMRGVCVLTGLLGTLLMPFLEHHIGLVRAGAWSISFELCCLVPAMMAFFFGAGVYGEQGPVWNQILLFGGIALSRVGLWSFDLCQLKELQQALDAHPRRNRLTALQIALQNVFDLLKYAMTLAAARPAQFKWTALGSVVAVGGGVVCYAVYLRGVRGHLVHLDWVKRC